MVQLEFTDFTSAAKFLKYIGVGVVTRNPSHAGFIWRSQIDKLNDEKQKIVSAYQTSSNKENHANGIVWTDPTTRLTWLISPNKSSCETKDHANGIVSEVNGSNLSGHNDWRLPSLRELKTIAAYNTSSSKRLYIKPELAQHAEVSYWSNSSHANGYMWNFRQNSYQQQQYKDGKIQWNSHGEYNGFGSSGYEYRACVICVRGSLPASSSWFTTLNKWADDNRIFDLPLIEKEIVDLEKLVIPEKVTIPIEILNLVNLKSLKLEDFDFTDPFIFT
jgi:hypothetical protein